MLKLNEYVEISEAVEGLEQLLSDPDIYDRAESYDIEEDPATLDVIVTLYDAAGGVLSSAKVDSVDVAEVYLEEHFDLEPIDHEDRDDDAAAGASPFGQ